MGRGPIVIGTRGSELARTQTGMVAEALITGKELIIGGGAYEFRDMRRRHRRRGGWGRGF